MHTGYFITGTDTDVGKTWATVSIMQHIKNQGRSIVGMKPVASGCHIQNDQLKNADALMIQAHSSIEVNYDLINPYAYEARVSPHIAGKYDPVNLDKILSCYKHLQTLADHVVVEGAGGWLSPINDQQDNCEMAIALALPVIMVVAIRLGCINHARLTERAILQGGVQYAGWIAVCSDSSMICLEETIQTLEDSLSNALLGVLPYRKPADFNFFSQQLRL